MMTPQTNKDHQDGFTLPQRGFTLIELMLALGIMASILAVLYSSFFITERSVRATDSSMLRLHEARMALENLRMELEGVLKYKNKADHFILKNHSIFGNPASGMEFYSSASVMPGPARVTYRVAEVDSEMVLLKSIKRALSEEDADEAEVLEGLVGFKVEAMDIAGTWKQTWRGGKTPKAIRISITLTISGRELLLTTTARPRVGGKA